MARVWICYAQRTHTCHCRDGLAIRGDDDIACHDGDGIDDAAHCKTPFARGKEALYSSALLTRETKKTTTRLLSVKLDPIDAHQRSLRETS